MPKIFYLTIILLFSNNTIGSTQSRETTESPDSQLLNAAREIMTSSSTCALITVDQEGRPRVRAMDPFSPESDFKVWFGTNAKSRKVDQIKLNPKVTLYYLEKDESGYVMLHGKAELINDPKEKDRRWKEEWETFYPDKSRDYLLIKVTPEWLEVSSTKRGIVGDTDTWAPPEVVFDHKGRN